MIYLFLAQGFEETEAVVPLDLMRRAGIKVITVGVGGQSVTGAHGITLQADAADREIDLSDTGGVVLPGGPGTVHLKKSPAVKEALRCAAEKGGLIAAICAAPSVPGEMGLLERKRAVCYPGYENTLKGAIVAEEPICVSGNIITARGAGCAGLFGLEIVKYLRGAEKSEEIKKSVMVP